MFYRNNILRQIIFLEFLRISIHINTLAPEESKEIIYDNSAAVQVYGIFAPTIIAIYSDSSTAIHRKPAQF